MDEDGAFAWRASASRRADAIRCENSLVMTGQMKGHSTDTIRRRLRALPGWAQNALLSVATIVVVLGLAEGAARIAERGRPPVHVADYIANWDEWDGEFFTAIGWEGSGTFNRDCLRDRNHALVKLPGVQRVVCLGDSTTYGQHLQPEQAYPQILQRLADARGLRLEVFNVALSGWAARQELIAYRRICRKYGPDHVLLMLCLNDIADMQNNLSRPPQWLLALHAHSALVRLVVGAEDREIEDVHELFENPPSAKVRDGWGRLFSEILKLREAAGADGADLGILILPFRFQVKPGAPPPLAQQTIAQFCAANGIPCLDLLPLLQPHGPAAFVCPDHLSPWGMQRVAEAVLSSGLIPATASRPAPHVPTSLPELLRALHADDAGLRTAAAAALGGHADQARAVAPALVECLGHDASENVRLAAGEALVRLKQDAGVVPSLSALVRADEAGSIPAARVLGSLGPRATAAIPTLITALGASRTELRRQAAWSLGEMGVSGGGAAPALAAVVSTEKNLGVRAEAIDALGKMGPAASAAVPALTEALADSSGDLRRLAARTLGRIGPDARPAGAALVPLLADDRADVRLMAARALARTNADLRLAEAPLERLTREPDRNIRREAKAALRHMRATQRTPNRSQTRP